MRRVASVIVAGIIAAGIVTSLRIANTNTDQPLRGKPYVTSVPYPDSHLGRFLIGGDGQFYEALALDLSLRHPEAFPSRSEAAYRAQRPLLPLLAWAAALGHPAALAPALVALCVLSVGFAAGACALLSLDRGGPLYAGAAALATPGAVAVIGGLGSEVLALGLVALGLNAWIDRRTRAASALFVLAAFARETTLLVPATLIVVELIRSRDARRLWVLVLPFAMWGAWLAWIFLRIDVLPGSQGRLAAPFTGLIHDIPGWTNVVPNTLALALGVGVVAAVALTRPRDLIGIIALAQVVLGVIAGPDVWHAWENFSRPLLPMYALGLVALLCPPHEDVLLPLTPQLTGGTT